MRIFSGKYKGRALSSFKTSGLRPMTQKTKETVFNKIRTCIEDAKVLDLFSGTGNLGLESLSWDAEFVCFVDKGRGSIKVLKKNIDLLKIPRNKYQIAVQDVFSFLKRNHENSFDIIFMDPPFTEKMAHSLMEAVSKSSIFHSDSIFILESSAYEDIFDCYSPLKLYDRKKTKDKFLSFYKVEV